MLIYEPPPPLYAPDLGADGKELGIGLGTASFDRGGVEVAKVWAVVMGLAPKVLLNDAATDGLVLVLLETNNGRKLSRLLQLSTDQWKKVPMQGYLS